MPALERTHDESSPRVVLHPGVGRERVLIGLVILALARSNSALCAELPGFKAHSLASPDPNLSSTAVSANWALPEPLSPLYVQNVFAAPRMPTGPAFSSKEFRPRGHSINESAERADGPAQPALMGNTTVWQRLSEYRSRDRVRVLTLWESGASTVSLQAGKKGDPSLQWTSRLMNRGGATRGLLDQLFAVSVAGASRELHGGSRTASTSQAAAKPMRMEAVSK